MVTDLNNNSPTSSAPLEEPSTEPSNKPLSETSHAPLRSRTLALFALAPVCASLMFAATRQTLPPLTSTADRPALLFATYLYHHGDEPIPLQPLLESDFRFRNEADVPVEITSV